MYGKGWIYSPVPTVETDNTETEKICENCLDSEVVDISIWDTFGEWYNPNIRTTLRGDKSILEPLKINGDWNSSIQTEDDLDNFMGFFKKY